MSERMMPKCPHCSKTLGWQASFSFWNPWNYRCPFCGTELEASNIQKRFALMVVPMGILLAAIPLYCERHGIWDRMGSFVFLGVSIAAIVAFALASWRYTRFTIKPDA